MMVGEYRSLLLLSHSCGRDSKERWERREAVSTNNPTFVHQPPPPESRVGAVPPMSEADLPLLARRFLSEAKADVTRLNAWKTTTELGRTRVNNMINQENY